MLQNEKNTIYSYTTSRDVIRTVISWQLLRPTDMITLTALYFPSGNVECPQCARSSMRGIILPNARLITPCSGLGFEVNKGEYVFEEERFYGSTMYV